MAAAGHQTLCSWAIFSNLDITDTLHEALSHLPFKMSHCKSKTECTPHLQHNFMAYTTTGATKAYLVLCMSETVLVTSNNYLRSSDLHAQRENHVDCSCTICFWSNMVDTRSLVNFQSRITSVFHILLFCLVPQNLSAQWSSKRINDEYSVLSQTLKIPRARQVKREGTFQTVRCSSLRKLSTTPWYISSIIWAVPSTQKLLAMRS